MDSYYLLGGDERMRSVQEELEKDGIFVEGGIDQPFQKSRLQKADVILCGVPFTGDGRHLFAPKWKEPYLVSDFLELLSPGQTVMGGRIPQPVIRSLEKRKIRWADYGNRESFQIRNALLTAEGALMLALQHMKTTLFGANVCVIGYGRIGTMLSERLEALGSHVSVATGKKDNFPWVESRKMRAISLKEMPSAFPTFDCIINTAPAPVIREEDWKLIPDGCVLIELASMPGGFVGAPQGRVISGAALPGKTAPVSAGRIIKETIMEIMGEWG